MLCPCSSKIEFKDCCEPIIKGELAKTAEQLMRARYTAYSQINMAFIEKTHDPKTIKNTDMQENKKWAEQTNWLNLDVIRTEGGGPEDETGVVEFKARYKADGDIHLHHEVSTFNKRNGKWYFTDGHTPEVKQVINEGPKVGRNDPCPCGSGKKFKKCCGT